MNPIVKNILAVISGIFVGGLINMGLINVGSMLIALPEGADQSTMEGFQASMKMMKPVNFLFPFLAHALGTLSGAYVAARFAGSHPVKLALGIGVFFLLGGATMVALVGGPVWFAVCDLGLAYIPMGYLGACRGENVSFEKAMKIVPAFSIKTLFVVTTAFALLVPSLVYPGAFLVYGPILAIFLVGIALLSSLLRFRERRWRCILLVILMVFMVTGFASVFDVALEHYRATTFTADQFNRVDSLKDPKHFHMLAIELHSQLMTRQPKDRNIRGDSNLVPPEIQRVHPVRIFASKEFLVISMTPSGESTIVIYPPGATIRRVSSYKVTEDFYYHGPRE